MKKQANNNPRLATVHTLANVLDRNLNLSDGDTSATLADPRDRALSKHLSYGVLRWLGSLEWIAGKLLSRPLKSRDKDVNRLIWIGLLQLWKDGGAEHAAVNETAECARSLGKPWAVGLVNAVLRRFQREQEKLVASLIDSPMRFAHPPWLLAQLQLDWPDEWPAIVAENNCAAALWLRINRAHPEQGEITRRLEEAGFSVTLHPFAPDALSISPAAAVSDIPGFRDGVLSVQDPAAQLAVDLLSLETGHRVLDACAAPGGKTCHILERYPALDLTAVELSETRLQRIRENTDRLGLEAANHLHLVTADATATDSWWDGQPFDRILLDSPCTATGVIRRHPEIKWLRSTQQVDDAVRLQERLLARLWPLLKPGGILVYATCSVLNRENGDQINHFLFAHDDAEAVPIDQPWGRESGCGRQILPGEAGMDGFFYACLHKTC
jgi:16S rRNA (cytosine967-C5)-methyltransferase